LVFILGNSRGSTLGKEAKGKKKHFHVFFQTQYADVPSESDVSLAVTHLN